MNPVRPCSSYYYCSKVLSNLKKKNMSVKLREKQIAGGMVSFYLDIYHNKARWYEFLDIHINCKKLTAEDKDKRRLANEIRSKREHELIVQDNGLIDKKKKHALFIPYFEKYFNLKDENGNIIKSANCGYRSTLYNLNLFVGKEPLTFSRITMEWMKDFERFLLKRVSNNTTLNYLKNINTVLNDAVRKKIIPSNTWHEVPKHERLKKQDIFRTALSLDQLQMLADTPYDCDPQIKQAYFFSCFTGLRWSDVNPLRWSKIQRRQINEEEHWFIYFEQEKTEAIEYLPLTEQAIEILNERMKEREQESEESIYVFPKMKETDPVNKLVQSRVNYALKSWAKAAAVKWRDKFCIEPRQMHFHNARHTFATNMLEAGIEGDIWTVSKLLGHKSLNSTQVYAHVRDQRKLAAVKALPKLKRQEA